MSEFQERLKEFLIENNLSRLQLAKRIGVHHESINCYFNRNIYPTISTAIRIANYFNCSIDYLMGMTEEYNNTDINNMSFKDTLKKLLKDKDISPEKLMKCLKMSDANYYRWQRGKTKPTIASLIAIAKYFDVSIDYLVSEYKK